MKDFEIIERLPTVEEYRTLCTAVGWAGIMNFEVAPQALAGSQYGVVVLDGDTTVGMGRIVGDGAMYFYLQDVAVLPDYHQSGVGRLILEYMLHYIQRTSTGAVFVGLFAAPGTEDFYRKFGFEIHEMNGMFGVFEAM